MSEILTNHKARRDYQIIDSFEAGLVLKGTEVKSLRAGRGQIADSFARIENGVPLLYNAHIEEYEFGNRENHKPKSPRRLLLNKSEIRKLHEASAIHGNSLVPLSFYWKNGKVKVLLGVGKGKDKSDRREDLKIRESDREIKRATMHRLKIDHDR